MNLTRDPWIPVIGTNGKHRLVSLETIFKEGDELADLAANPCQRIALMRLLICIAQAALDGPDDEAGWRTCRPRIAPAALDYLARWQDRFNLFGEHAFLQVDGLEVNHNGLADKLDFMLACGNNPTLFDQAAYPEGRIPDGAQLALRLLVYQVFSPGGLIGTAVWKGTETGRTSEHAPCLEGSMLHTLLKGSVISESLHLNLLNRRSVETLPNAEWGTPYWECDEFSTSRLEMLASTYLGRLVPLPRAIRCEPETSLITLASGVRYPKLPEWREPCGTIIRTGKGNSEKLTYVAVNPAKHPWRELGSILALASADTPGGAFPLMHMRNLEDRTFEIWTGGLAADKAKLVDMAEWSFTLPSSLLESPALRRYQSGVALSGDGNFILRQAIKKYADALKAEAIWGSEAQRCFWTLLDSESSRLCDCAAEATGDLSLAWLPVIRSAMLAAYAQCCPHETPRQIQAYAQGLKVIESWKGVLRDE